MAIAQTLIDYLKTRGIDFYTVEHKYSETARESARTSHLPAHQIAKAVVLRDFAGFVVSVIPGNRKLEVDWVNEALLGRNLELASEKEFAGLFKDCEPGAVPALSEAYGIAVVWDDQLGYTSDIFIEAGDHEHLICLERKDFKNLMSSLPHSIISKGSEYEHWKH
jgi:Ala-tRNA(Pro) deacylase